ncbi:MAG: D-alanyl-D-alanine carboxypeptidase [Cyanobacteria bacterium REEB65]|nr:D-alanyl-D-alanine carboxypeptidase [Cyanobacteria bacterium REEB65]
MPVPALPPPPPAITARAAVLMDGDTGQVLYERDPHERLPQASTTKLMTALVAAEDGNLNQVVTVATRSARVGGSSMYLEAGERLTLDQLLYGLLMVSGNDAADAIAGTVGGTVDHFVDMMNAKAAALHLTDTHYANPHGLPAPNHFSSAYDLAMIARAAFANPEIAKIADTKRAVLPGNDRIARRVFVNHNKLLGRFPGAWDGKTGYTVAAGKCFVGSARRDGRFVIEAILHSRKLWPDAASLLNYGLNDFHNAVLVPASTIEGRVTVLDGRDRNVAAVPASAVAVTLQQGQTIADFKSAVALDPPLHAPVVAGQILGSMEIRDPQGNLVATDPLVARVADPKGLPIALRLLGAVGWFFSGGIMSVGLFGMIRRRRLRARTRRVRRQDVDNNRQPTLV